MNTNELINELKSALCGVQEPHEVAALVRIIMEEVFNYSPVDVLLRGEVEQPSDLVERAREVAQRLVKGEPIQYIFGSAHFHGHDFKVTPATLIPRLETEMLVDKIVDDAHDAADLRVLDLGTGSGCIAISLARALKWAEVWAVDLSAEALSVARENAKHLKVKVNFLQRDILAPLGSHDDAPEDSRALLRKENAALPQEDYFDVIVSNPPYVCESERADMERHVLDHEPATALFVSNENPLVFYRAIARYGIVALKPGGRLYFEINRRFGAEIAALLAGYGFTQISIDNDQFGNVRFATGVKP